MFQNTLNELLKFLSEENGIIISVKFKDEKYKIDRIATNYLNDDNEICVEKIELDKKTSFQYFYLNSFGFSLNNIAYDDDYDGFYIDEPNSAFEGFGLTNYRREMVNLILLLINKINDSSKFSRELCKLI